MHHSALIVGLGEVLWDIAPAGFLLGGAPANFAYMCASLGNHAVIASRVGADVLAEEMRAELHRRGLSIEFLQTDGEYVTGTSWVSLDGERQPDFRIPYPAAWDRLSWTEQWSDLASQADVVCFGSLAQRSEISARTVQEFLNGTRSSTLRVYDANLRAPFDSPEILQRSLGFADVVKLNEHELKVVSHQFHLEGSDVVQAKSLLQQFNLKLVCVTRGAHGSLLVDREEAVEHPGVRVTVADAIKAGDAFTACMVHLYLRGRSLSHISEAANRFAAWVATQVGATPSLQGAEFQRLEMYG